MDKIAVITLTRGRRHLLSRAMDSVARQDYGGPIDHIVICDDDQETYSALCTVAKTSPGTVFPVLIQRNNPLASHDVELRSIYPRLAAMLNHGVRIADSRWIAFLDDDNEYEPNHLSSLVSCARRFKCRAVHSHRAVFDSAGNPYLERRFPWTAHPEKSSRIYELFCRKGVWKRDSNILADRAGPYGYGEFRNSTIANYSDPVFLVDTSVWLLDRNLCLQYPVPEEFSDNDFEANNAPDDKFLEQLLRNDIPIVSTGLPTLRYYLGGVSN